MTYANGKLALAALAALFAVQSAGTATAGPRLIETQTIQLDRQLLPRKAIRPQIDPGAITRGCVDLAAELVQIPRSDGTILVRYGVRNVSGVDYVSGANQQMVLIDANGTAKSFRFANLSAGQQKVWSEVFRPFEFPGIYKVQLSFDPDIRTDNNPRNDDCRAANNSAQLTTAR